MVRVGVAKFIQLTALGGVWSSGKKKVSVNVARVLTVTPAENGSTVWFGGADKIEVDERYEEVVRMMFEAGVIA
jgi:hypothetical protein